jgi:hypothetical protein
MNTPSKSTGTLSHDEIKRALPSSWSALEAEAKVQNVSPNKRAQQLVFKIGKVKSTEQPKDLEIGAQKGGIESKREGESEKERQTRETNIDILCQRAKTCSNEHENQRSAATTNRKMVAAQQTVKAVRLM